MSKLILSVEGVVLHTYELDLDVMLIGRKAECDIYLDDDAVSGEHARITLLVCEYLENFKDAFLEDLGSTNGSRVNGESITKMVQLKHNDRIKIGRHEFKYDTGLGRDELERTAIYLPEED